MKKFGQIDILPLFSEAKGLLPMQHKFVEYGTEYITQVDLLLDISHSIKSPRSAWSDMIQKVNKDGKSPGKSPTFFLSMLDIDPGETR